MRGLCTWAAALEKRVRAARAGGSSWAAAGGRSSGTGAAGGLLPKLAGDDAQRQRLARLRQFAAAHPSCVTAPPPRPTPRRQPQPQPQPSPAPQQPRTQGDGWQQTPDSIAVADSDLESAWAELGLDGAPSTAAGREPQPEPELWEPPIELTLPPSAPPPAAAAAAAARRRPSPQPSATTRGAAAAAPAAATTTTGPATAQSSPRAGRGGVLVGVDLDAIMPKV
jgi:hypothetical protein